MKYWSFEDFKRKQKKVFLTHADYKGYKSYIPNTITVILFLAI